MRIGLAVGGALEMEKVKEAINLYKKGEISKVIFTSFPEKHIEYAIKSGIDGRDLIVSYGADTAEELYACKKVLNFYNLYHDVSEIYIIAPWWHLPRIKLIAKGILRGYKVRPVPVYESRNELKILKHVGLEIPKSAIDLLNFVCRREDVYKNTSKKLKDCVRQLIIH
jgi:uncharacterized SAM-binding protein YcdF (DUF218 family)